MQNIHKPASELTKLEYALIHSLWMPNEDDIITEVRKDRQRNPHNYPDKPALRCRDEIVRDLKVKYFTMLLNQ